MRWNPSRPSGHVRLYYLVRCDPEGGRTVRWGGAPHPILKDAQSHTHSGPCDVSFAVVEWPARTLAH